MPKLSFGKYCVQRLMGTEEHPSRSLILFNGHGVAVAAVTFMMEHDGLVTKYKDGYQFMNTSGGEIKFRIHNLTDGFLAINLLHRSDTVHRTNPGPEYGLNAENEFRPHDSYVLRANQKTGRTMFLNVRAPETGLTVDQAEAAGDSTFTVYLSVIPSEQCSDKFDNNMHWKCTDFYVIKKCTPQGGFALNGGRGGFALNGGRGGFALNGGRGGGRGITLESFQSRGGGASHCAAPAPSRGSFSFGAPAAGGFSLGSAPAAGGFGAAPAAGGFSLGSAPAAAPAAAAAAAPAPSRGSLSFGAPVVGGFSLGAAPAAGGFGAAAAAPAAGGFSLGAAPAAGGFGAADAAPAAGGFSLGAAPAAGGFGAAAAPAAGGFSLGAAGPSVGQTFATDLGSGEIHNVQTYETNVSYDYSKIVEACKVGMSIHPAIKLADKRSDDIEYQYELIQDFMAREKESMVNSIPTVFESDTCVISLTEPADTILAVCGHKCINHAYATDRLEKCPLCRARVAGFVRS